MRSADAPALRVSIVGAGYSGTMLAVHLLRSSHSVHIDLIDTRIPGRGLAYSTVWDRHLLNVPAARMSAFASNPAHFLEWLKSHGQPEAQPESFASRKVFGSYVQDILQAAVAANSATHRFRHLGAKAVRVTHNGSLARVSLDNGDRIAADRVVLATGNPAPRNFCVETERYFNAPWESGAVIDLKPDATVLLLGSGLTAVDAFLALEAQGHRGTVFCLSRRGKLPQPHTLYRVLPDPFIPGDMKSARHLLRAIRLRVRKAKQEGYDWRAVIDSLRPITNEIWGNFDHSEKARVLRHLKTWWDIHRHRMAPEIGVRIEDAVRARRLRVLAGRLKHLTTGADRLHLEIKLRSQRIMPLDVDRLINCTGPEAEYTRLSDPLIRSLMESGLARCSSMGTGLRTDSSGSLLDSEGNSSDWLFAVGPLRFGTLFETTAVPELRIQSESLANHLLSTPYEPVEPPFESYMAAGI